MFIIIATGTKQEAAPASQIDLLQPPSTAGPEARTEINTRRAHAD